MPKYKDMRNNSPDNFQTYPGALDCLVPFLIKEWLIWEPAAGNGNLLRSLIKRGFAASGSDILTGRDFMHYEREEYDAIVTNPPFSIKQRFLGRCYHLGKPFALLMPLTTFDSAERRRLFRAHGIEIIMPPGRINFETPNHEANKAIGKKTTTWFYSCWFTHGLNIGQQITFSD